MTEKQKEKLKDWNEHPVINFFFKLVTILGLIFLLVITGFNTREKDISRVKRLEDTILITQPKVIKNINSSIGSLKIEMDSNNRQHKKIIQSQKDMIENQKVILKYIGIRVFTTSANKFP